MGGGQKNCYHLISAPPLLRPTCAIASFFLTPLPPFSTPPLLHPVRVIAFPSKVEFMQAFARAPKLSQSASLPPLAGWDVYNPYRELDRLGVL